jgi:hypothetical protein
VAILVVLERSGTFDGRVHADHENRRARAHSVLGAVPLEARKGTILNVGLLNLVPVTGRLGHVVGGIPPDT